MQRCFVNNTLFKESIKKMIGDLQPMKQEISTTKDIARLRFIAETLRQTLENIGSNIKR